MIPAYLLAFLAKHWRPIAFVALILAAFAAGRFATPTKTVTVERIQWKDRVVTQVVEKQAEQKETVKTVVVYRDVIKHTDGSTETKSETRAVTGTQDNTESAATTNTVATSEGTKSTTVTTDAPRRWSADIGIGMPLSLKAPLSQTPFIIGDVGYQFLGPFSIEVGLDADIKTWKPAAWVGLGVSF